MAGLSPYSPATPSAADLRIAGSSPADTSGANSNTLSTESLGRGHWGDEGGMLPTKEADEPITTPALRTVSPLVGDAGELPAKAGDLARAAAYADLASNCGLLGPVKSDIGEAWKKTLSDPLLKLSVKDQEKIIVALAGLSGDDQTVLYKALTPLRSEDRARLFITAAKLPNAESFLFDLAFLSRFKLLAPFAQLSSDDQGRLLTALIKIGKTGDDKLFAALGLLNDSNQVRFFTAITRLKEGDLDELLPAFVQLDENILGKLLTTSAQLSDADLTNFFTAFVNLSSNDRTMFLSELARKSDKDWTQFLTRLAKMNTKDWHSNYQTLYAEFMPVQDVGAIGAVLTAPDRMGDPDMAGAYGILALAQRGKKNKGEHKAIAEAFSQQASYLLSAYSNKGSFNAGVVHAIASMLTSGDEAERKLYNYLSIAQGRKDFIKIRPGKERAALIQFIIN